MWCDDGITGCCEVQDGSPMGVQGYATDAVESHASEHGIPLGLVTRMKGGNCAGDTTVKGLTGVLCLRHNCQGAGAHQDHRRLLALHLAGQDGHPGGVRTGGATRRRPPCSEVGPSRRTA